MHTCTHATPPLDAHAHLTLPGWEQVVRLVMRADTTLYIIEPDPADEETLASEEYRKVKADATW